MPLPLDKTLKREILLDGRPYTVTVTPRGVRVTAKGFRKGRAVSWRALLAQSAPEDGPEDGPPAGG